MPQPANTLITRARVFTADPDHPHAEAVAVRGQRIVFVGSAEEAEGWRGPRTRVIEGQGRTLMPGFIDSHFHLLWGSLELGDIQLGEAKTLEGLTTAVRAFANEHPDIPWLVGRGLSYAILPDKQPLTRQRLDAVISARPLIVFAFDTHTAWANTEALRRANLLKDGRTVSPNSEIVLGPDGLAQGELREPGAYRPVMDLIPPPDEARKRALLHQGLAQAAACGMTSVHNMDGNAEDVGELTLRIYVPYSVTPHTPLEALAEAAALREQYQSEMVRSGCV